MAVWVEKAFRKTLKAAMSLSFRFPSSLDYLLASWSLAVHVSAAVDNNSNSFIQDEYAFEEKNAFPSLGSLI